MLVLCFSHFTDGEAKTQKSYVTYIGQKLLNGRPRLNSDSPAPESTFITFTLCCLFILSWHFYDTGTSVLSLFKNGETETQRM